MRSASRLAFLAFSLLPIGASHAADDGFGNWAGLFAQGTFNPNWGWYAEAQTRLNEGYQSGEPANARQLRNNRQMYRPAVRYLPYGNGSLQLHLGYAWTPNQSPSRDESRIYQQALWQDDGDDFWWALRGRLEQRWIENASGASHRVRLFGRAQKYLASSKSFGIALTGEAFWGLNSVDGGPKEGFDQTRIFIGPHFKLNAQTRFEFGYLNNYLDKGRDAVDVVNHMFLVYTYLEM